MRLKDCAHDGKAHAHSVIFGGKEWVEPARQRIAISRQFGKRRRRPCVRNRDVPQARLKGLSSSHRSIRRAMACRREGISPFVLAQPGRAGEIRVGDAPQPWLPPALGPSQSSGSSAGRDTPERHDEGLAEAEVRVSEQAVRVCRRSPSASRVRRGDVVLRGEPCLKTKYHCDELAGLAL